MPGLGVTVHPRHSEAEAPQADGPALSSASEAMDDVLGHLAFLAAGTGPWSGATVQAESLRLRLKLMAGVF